MEIEEKRVMMKLRAGTTVYGSVGQNLDSSDTFRERFILDALEAIAEHSIC